MERHTKPQLEAALKIRLPSYDIHCKAHTDGSLSVDLTDPGCAVFAITGIVITDYVGPQGISRLARQIVEDMTLAQQGSKTARVQRQDLKTATASSSSLKHQHDC